MTRTARQDWWRGHAMPMRAMPERDGRVYRKIAYGPLLDVFLIDMRSYRDSTWNKRDDGSETFILGPTQLAWLKRELVASDATWKVIAADLPIGLISGDAVALGDGPPERREHEIANLLSFMKRAGIRNTLWLTADMHYTAAHHYDPNRAAFQDFEPFWEFVSGPLHAGTWAPGRTRQHVWTEGGVPERLQRRAGRKPCPLFWPAILRPRRYRRPDGNHDGDPEGCR
jgi:alkaline phosphatase D